MKSVPNNSWCEISEDAARQYINARSVFTAYEEACQEAVEVRGGMYWKSQGQTSYLIRTSIKNSQKSLGPRSAETEAIFQQFTTRKTMAEQRLAGLSTEMICQQRMNRALHVGHAPQLLVEILSRIAKAGLTDHFTVVGTHALYAYEAAAGVRFMVDAMTTRLSFVTQVDRLDVLNLLQKADHTFAIRKDQGCTALNSRGFEVEIISGRICGELTEQLQNGKRFSEMVVASTGHMARMNTIHPLLWGPEQKACNQLKQRRDLLQALVEQYLPHLLGNGWDS